MKDAFLRVARPAHTEIEAVKGSRFIGDAFPIGTAEEALRLVESVRAREPKATHHCWAYRLDPDGHAFRVSDDGEPTGSAGLPILRQIESLHLAETLVVVTRYYGGTKLGVGGLIRAYGKAAGAVLNDAPTVERLAKVSVRLEFDYPDTAAATQTLHRFDAEIVDSIYDARTRLDVLVARSQAADFIDAFSEALADRGRASIG